jgi:hypothetical protein
MKNENVEKENGNDGSTITTSNKHGFGIQCAND